LLLSGCNYTSVRQTFNYKEIIAKYNTMVLLPVEVEINSIDAGGKTKRFYDYEYHLESLVKDNVVPEMRLNGFQISFLSRKDAHDRGIYNEILQLRKEVKEKMSSINHDKLKIENDAYSIDVNFGQYATRIGEVENADLIMMVDFSGYARTTGAKIVGLLTNNPQPVAGSKMNITIIDAKTGDLLWNNTAHEEDVFFTSSSNNRTRQDKIDNNSPYAEVEKKEVKIYSLKD
jgi:hypothetical protein